MHKLKRTAIILLTALLTAVLIFSSIMTVFAWSDFTQSRTNDFRGTVAKTSVTLHKYEIDAQGNIIPVPVRNAQFKLFKIETNGDRQIGGIFETSLSGKITVEKLNSGKYYFEETAPGYGFTYDKNDKDEDIKRYEFEITADDALGLALVEVEAYNRRLTDGRLEVVKTVKSEELIAPSERAFEFTILFSDGNSYPYKINGAGALKELVDGKFYLKHGETAVFENLPIGVFYKVTETPAENYFTQNINDQGSIRLEETAKAEFINTYTEDEPDDKNITITVEKIVEGEIPASEKDREFWFTFQKNDDEPMPFSLKPSDPDKKTKTFILKSGDTYSITEDDPFQFGYIQTSAVNGSGTACSPEIKVTFVNTYIGTVWTTISGEKSWDLKDDPNAKKPESIIVELLANGVVVQTATVKDPWTYSFMAPKYDADGKKIEYTLREVPVPGFISTVDGNNIKNTWVETVTNAPAKVKKIITGAKPATDDIFTFNLRPIGNAPMPGAGTVTVIGEGEVSFGDIKFTNAGTYKYEISEVKGDANCKYDETIYTMTVVVEESGGKLVVKSVTYQKPGDNGKYDKATFTNDYGNLDETSISVRKVWAGDKNSAQPDSVTVQLYKDGNPHGDPVALNAANEWKHTWTKLDKNAKWTVDETEVPKGYTKTITGDASTGFVITNTWGKPGDEEIIISGLKTWQHGDNPVVSRPNSITVYIMDGDRVAAQTEVTEAEHWQWTFKLPKYREDGKTVINYTVDEDKVDGYTKTVDGYNLVNTHNSTTPGDGEILLSGKKTWNYAGAPENDRPSSITVIIKNGDKTVKELNVTEEDSWQWSALLPKNDDKGNPINYTITEGNVPHYTHTVDGYDLINTYKGPDYPGDSPKTGDDSKLALWLSLTAGSLMMLIITVIMGRGRKYQGKYYKHAR